jgi:hypothetical protein
MLWRMKRLPLIAAVLLSCASAHAQSGIKPPPQKSAVTVNLIEGEPVKGKLVKADSETIVLEMGAVEATIKTEKVQSIVFDASPDSNAPLVEDKSLKSKEVEAAEKIVSALRRLDNAIEVGVMFQNYSALLIENKTTIDENLPHIKNVEFSLAVGRTMVDHQYAMYVWNLAVANNWSKFFTKQEPGRTLITKYGVPVKISIWTDIPVMTGLRYVWLSARNNYNAVNVAFDKMNTPQPEK